MPVLLLLTIIVILLIRFGGTRSDKQETLSSADFWKREHDANFVRRTDLSGLSYLNVPQELADKLPQVPAADCPDPSVAEEYEELRQTLADLSGAPVLNLTGLTNTELKLRYGPANLEHLTRCDENFTLLCRTLNRLGRLLVSFGREEGAVRILSFAVDCTSDIQESYLLLASLYRKAGDREALLALSESVKVFDGLRRSSLEDALEAYHIPE